MTLTAKKVEKGYGLFEFDELFEEVSGLWAHEDSARQEHDHDVRIVGSIEITPAEKATRNCPGDPGGSEITIDVAEVQGSGTIITDPRDLKHLELVILDRFESEIDQALEEDYQERDDVPEIAREDREDMESYYDDRDDEPW